MRCVRCNRPINTAAVSVGIYSYGPKCAKTAGLLAAHSAAVGALRKARSVKPQQDERQADWIAEAT